VRRNISSNIVSIDSMRIAEVREEAAVMVRQRCWRPRGRGQCKSRVVVGRPFHLSADDDCAARIGSFCDSS